MNQTTDEMRRNLEYISSQVDGFEEKLRKKEQSILSKIEAERSVMERFAARRDFYEKMQANMGPGEEQAAANLKAAQNEMALVQQKIAELESSNAELEESIREENERIVLPELEQLRQLLEGTKDEISATSRACAADEQRLQELTLLKETMDREQQQLRQTIGEREEALAILRAAPDAHAETLARAQQEAAELQRKIDDANKATEEVREEIIAQQRRRSEIEEHKRSEETKTRREQRALEERRLRVEGVAKELEGEKIRHCSLAAQRLELELQSQKAEEEIRHASKFLAVEKRQLALAKASLVKKEQSAANLKSSIPQMASKLQILELSLSATETEKLSCEKALQDIKQRVDVSYQKLYDSQNVEEGALLRLEESAKSVAERECQIEQARIDEKKINLLCSLLKERRRITQRQLRQAEQSSKDADLAMQYQEMQKLDLTKKKRDADKRAGDFETLHDIIRREKVDSTLLVGDTKRALDGIVSRCAELQVELGVHTTKRDRIMEALQDEVDAGRAAQHARASRCTDKSKSWSSYQKSLEEVQKQEADIDRAEQLLINSQKEVARSTSNVKQAMGAKQSIANQLQLRKAQLAAIHNSLNKCAEAQKRQELGIHRAEEERQATELKNKDIQRRIDILKRGLENPADIENKIEACKKKLELQILEMEKLSHECETPTRRQFNALEGEDPSKEELEAKLAILERLARNKKDALLTAKIAVKEVSFRIQQLETSTQDNAKICALLKERNEIQGHVHERKRLRLAQQSEILMYGELIATGMTKMADIEQDIRLREQLTATDRSESGYSVSDAPSADTPAESSPLALRFERSTAYLPADDGTDTIVRVPKPYGALAPFAPGTIMSRTCRKAVTINPSI